MLRVCVSVRLLISVYRKGGVRRTRRVVEKLILTESGANFEGAAAEKRVFFRFFSDLSANERKRPAKRAFVGASRRLEDERRRGVGGGCATGGEFSGWDG